MASIIIRTSGKQNKVLLNDNDVSGYLRDRGLIYRFWGVDRVTGPLKESYRLTSDEQRELLDLYAGEIAELKAGQGYVTEDLVVLSEETPHLEVLLAKFRREHHHRDDEVRFVVDGAGVFTIRQGLQVFDVLVEPGDLLVVPAYTRHCFDLMEERRIKCIRVFKDPAGWEAIYDEPAETTHSK